MSEHLQKHAYTPGAIHYLCSDASKFVPGIVIPIDGGFSAFSGV